MKKATIFISLLITLLFSLAGCVDEKSPNELPEITIDQILFEETGYSISQIQWLNNEEIFLKTVQTIAVDEENNLPTYKLYTFNTETNKGTLLYEGLENDYHMDGNTLILCDNNKMYVYNAEYCLEFNDLKLEKSHDLKEKFDEVFGENMYKATSLNINKEGFCSLIYKGDIVTFSLDDIENYEVLIKQTSEIVDADKLINVGLDDYKQVPATYYYLPLWSPDGKWILYNERESLESHDSTVIMYHTTDKKKKSFDFKYMDYYRWADTSNYVIACTWPTQAPKPEIKVYNLNTDEYKAFVLDEAINDISFQGINVLDVAGSKILLSCYKGGIKPLLMLDFTTGEKKWVTKPNSAVSSAIISPDLDKILYYNINADIGSIEVLNIDQI